jgi:asparagine synthase (glutamine-hydrolysing)
VCGIAGVLDLTGTTPPDVVDRQLRALVHRGPDSSGVYARGPALLGQTRLAVIDVVCGDPPITDESGTIGVALNGEIYNFRSLRKRLDEDGHVFRTNGDTEVIAHLAESCEAVELASLLEGMFAFAIWDDARQRLVLGRDRLGKKPLFYWIGDGLLVFGSEIKAVLAHPRVPHRLEPKALEAYLSFGYVPTPRTFFEGIRSLAPGTVLTVDGSFSHSVDTYWSPPLSGANGLDPINISVEEAAEEVRSRLTRAVERRLVADVPLGAFLSGGIDSSTIVGLMSQLSDEPVRTFTIGFEDDDGFDERAYARLVARHFRTEHVEYVVRPNAVDLVERLVWHHDQPFGDSTALPTFLLSEVTRRHVTVALSGDGGDELFAGYERFAAELLLDRYRRVPEPFRRCVGRAVGAIPDRWLPGRSRSLKHLVQRSEIGGADGLRSWLTYVSDKDCLALLPTSSGWALEGYRRMWDASAGADLLGRMLNQNLRTYLLDDLLPKVDRMSMAHGLEVRSPFLDLDLVEFALRLPRRAQVKGMSLKRVLKAAVADLVPPEVLRRPKRGFGIPLCRWFRCDLRNYVRATLGSPSARIRHLLDPASLDAIVRQHADGVADHGHALWALLTLELFLQKEGW